jgi:hypothetical protein
MKISNDYCDKCGKNLKDEPIEAMGAGIKIFPPILMSVTSRMATEDKSISYDLCGSCLSEIVRLFPKNLTPKN